MKKILFFDDFFIHRQESIRRVIHSPRWLDDKSYGDPSTNYGIGYSSVVPKSTGGFSLYYITVLDGDDNGQRLSLLRKVDSEDGLAWESKPTDILGGIPVPAGCSVLYDPHEIDQAAKYKLTNSPVKHITGGIETIPSYLLASPDGLNWHMTNSQFLPHHSDTYNSLIWNPVAGQYQITSRRKWGERRVCLIESADLCTWSEPRTIIHPDSIDPPSTHFYGMPQFYLESAGMFVGFLWNQRMPYNDVMGGPVRTEFAYSYDGRMWNRTRHTALDVRELGDYGGGSMYGAALIERDDSILVYAIARLQEHSNASTGKLLPGILRKDGMASLRTDHGVGEITTECLLLSSPSLFINVVAPFDAVTYQLCTEDYRPIPGYTFAESDRICGDHLEAPLGWNGSRDLRRFADEKAWVRLQLRLTQSELFSITGDFSVNININAPV